MLLPSGDKWEVCLICHFAMLLLNGRMHVIALFTILPCYCLTAVCFINELIYDDVDFRYVDFKIVFLIFMSLYVILYGTEQKLAVCDKNHGATLLYTVL